MTKQQEDIKDWIRTNLVISVECEFNYSPGNNMVVGIRFKEEDQPFTEATIYIPDYE